MNDEYEIIDDNGVVYSGYTYDELIDIFECANFDWVGDLKLVKVISRKR